MALAKRLLSGDGFAFETLTVAGTAVGFSTATYQATGQNIANLKAVCTLIGGAIRYRYDGGTPTATVGHRASHGDFIEVNGSVNVGNFKAIREGGNSGTLSVTFESVYG